MSVFKTNNFNVEKTYYTLAAKNIEISSDHWGSEKYITAFFDEVENFLYHPDDFNKKIISHSLNLLKSNRRIKEAAFYRIPDKNQLILAVITEVRKLHDFETFSREITAFYKKNKFSFSIVEIVEEDDKLIKDGKQKIPSDWIFDEKMTDKLDTLKDYI
jgi:acyl-CoA synthetase (AMP-forming)/AMP-acid ligase II